MKMRFLIVWPVVLLLGAACAAAAESEMLADVSTPMSPVATAAIATIHTAGDSQSQSPNALDAAQSPALPNMGRAPAWNNDVWINSDRPLLLEDLHGKVVLLEFWTFG